MAAAVWRKLQAAVAAKIAAEPDLRAAHSGALALVRARRRRETAAPLHPDTERALAGLRVRLGLDRFKHAITAAAPCPPDVHEFFLALGVPFAELYGMTETGVITMTRPDPADVGTVGRPIPGVELRLAPNGEVFVRAAGVTPGYLGRAEATAALIDPEGWIHTGDVGQLDSSGRLRIVDRLKELIVSDSGHNMSPSRIEARLTAAGRPIAHACVIGDARPYNVALIVLDPEAAGRLADPARAPAVLAEVGSAVARANEAMDDRERVVRHIVLPTTWTPGGDMLTPTGKLRRRPIAAAYAAEIEALYAG